MSGEHTGEFGLWLDRFIAENNLPLRVYYDHGNKTFVNVGIIQGYIGSGINRTTILTECDLMVVDPSDQILVLIEIEDKATLVPKKLIGTIFATMLCDRFAFGSGKAKRIFAVTRETRFIIAGQFKSKGKKFDQLKETICPKVRECRLPGDGIQAENLRFVFEGTTEETISELKNLMQEMLR